MTRKSTGAREYITRFLCINSLMDRARPDETDIFPPPFPLVPFRRCLLCSCRSRREEMQSRAMTVLRQLFLNYLERLISMALNGPVHLIDYSNLVEALKHIIFDLTWEGERCRNESRKLVQDYSPIVGARGY